MQFRLSKIQGPITFDLANWKDVSIVVIFILMTLLTLSTKYLLCKISKLSAILSAIPTADAVEMCLTQYFLFISKRFCGEITIKLNKPSEFSNRSSLPRHHNAAHFDHCGNLRFICYFDKTLSKTPPHQKLIRLSTDFQHRS